MLREKGERKKKIKMKRKKESWNALTSEFGGSGRLQKRKEVKKRKVEGYVCGGEKKRGEKKEGNMDKIKIK